MPNLKSVGHKSTNPIVRVGAVGVHLGKGSLDILRDDVTSVEQRTGHCEQFLKSLSFEMKRRTAYPFHQLATDHLAAAPETGSSDITDIVNVVRVRVGPRAQ
jgi:hypothetical protein